MRCYLSSILLRGTESILRNCCVFLRDIHFYPSFSWFSKCQSIKLFFLLQIGWHLTAAWNVSPYKVDIYWLHTWQAWQAHAHFFRHYSCVLTLRKSEFFERNFPSHIWNEARKNVIFINMVFVSMQIKIVKRHVHSYMGQSVKSDISIRNRVVAKCFCWKLTQNTLQKMCILS